MQGNPWLRHEPTLVEHTLFELNLHLHRIIFNKHSGATALSVLISINVVVCSDSPPPIFWF